MVGGLEMLQRTEYVARHGVTWRKGEGGEGVGGGGGGGEEKREEG